MQCEVKNIERFRNFLYELRKEKGMTQQELADKLCVTNRAVSKWETGETFPETGAARAACKYLRWSPLTNSSAENASPPSARRRGSTLPRKFPSWRPPLPFRCLPRPRPLCRASRGRGGFQADAAHPMRCGGGPNRAPVRAHSRRLLREQHFPHRQGGADRRRR